MRGLALCTKSHWLVSEHRRFAFADIRRSPLSNSHVQSAKAIAEDIAHLCCVPDDWRLEILQISDLAAWPSPTFCAKPDLARNRHRPAAARLTTVRWVPRSRCARAAAAVPIFFDTVASG